MPFGRDIRRVVLIGFMGAGKSSVGRILSSMLGWRCVDADAELVKATGMSIAAFFASEGEARFRERESRLVAELLGRDHTVIALGGGAVEDAGNLHQLQTDPHTLLVHLHVSLAVSLGRCARSGGAAARPVLRAADALEARYRARLPLYESAHLTVSTERGTPRAAAATIARVVRSRRTPAPGAIRQPQTPSSSRQ